MTGPSPQDERKWSLRRLLQTLAPFFGLLIVVVIFTILRPESFPNQTNVINILRQTVIVGISALGMTFVITSAGIDLSVGSTIALSSVVTAKVLESGAPTSVGCLAGVATGAAMGLLNGTLITGLAVVPFVVTLGTMGIARGVAKSIASESSISAPTGWLGNVLSSSADAAWLGLPPGIWLFAALAVLMAAVLRSTSFGVRTVALGSNESTARLCGVPVPRTKILVYTLAGVFAGLSGVLLFARLTIGDPTSAIGLELNVIAAVVIGGASLSGGKGTILGSMIGAFLMSTLANGCDLTGVPNYVQEILVGAIIVAAVALDRLRSSS